MNWLGWSLGSFLATIVACVLAFYGYGLFSAHRVEAMWFVGLTAGGVVAATSAEKSTMRGLFVGTLAIWTAAIAQANYLGTGGIISGLVHFHEALNWPRFTQLLLCGLLAVGLGSNSFRSNARQRVLGT